MYKHTLNKLMIGLVIGFFIMTSLSSAQNSIEQKNADELEQFSENNWSSYSIPGPTVLGTRYYDGSEIELETEIITEPICGSNPTHVSADDLRYAAESALERFEAELADPSDGDVGSRGLNIIFNYDYSGPSGATGALADAEAYIESVFDDSETIYIDVSFANLPSGILGWTSSSYTYDSWTDTRNGLTSGMDADDSIQNYLPSGSTIPVRYNGGSSTVTNENRCYFTTANYEAAIGNVGGTDGDIEFNTDYNSVWDWDPSNGISSGKTCFQSVIVHEVGHALGFTSNADGSSSDIEALDIYRFQRTDGSGDYNPDTLAEFQTTARLVDYNTPNDDHNSDLISVEYRMSDGTPYQASHFRQGSVSGLMQPAIGSGYSFYPNFFRTADINMFDAIGWDYTTVPSYTLTVNIAGDGYVIKDPDQSSYLVGTSVDVTAVADPGWSFDHWSGDDIDGSTTNPETLVMDADKTVTAYFTQDQYTLTVNIVGSGSVVKNPNQATYTYDTPVELTANAIPDWGFCYWSGDDIDGSTDNPETIIMDSSKVVTAYFSEDPEWRNQGQNLSTVEVGGSILLYAEGMDDNELDEAWLSTNESGAWETYAGGEWWVGHSDWNYKKEITIDHSLVPSDQTNFPVLISHISGDFASHAQGDGDDFAFVDSSNTVQYSHEIEYYDDGSGELVAWVNIPLLSSSVDTTLFVYYGNPGASNQEDLVGTWDSDFITVQHMTGASYSDLDDSSQNGWDVTSMGGNPTFNQVGKAGYCVDFDGLGDYFKASGFRLGTDDSHTGSAWVYVDGDGGRRYAFEGDSDYGISLLVWTDDRFKAYARSSGGTPVAYSTTTVDIGSPEWFYITTRANAAADELEIFVNGVSEGSGVISGTINPETAGLNIGTFRDNDDYWMDGLIDEVRISDSVRSGDWITTEYNNMVDPIVFASVDVEVPRGGEKHGSPMDVDGAPSEWVYTEFTWQEPTVTEGTVVGWKIIYVDGWRNQGETDVMSFTVGDSPPEEYTLTVNVVGSGSVGKDPDQATYAYGTPVLLTANADPGWSFDRWEGDLTGGTNPDTITIYDNSVVDCYFTQDQYTLTVNIVGSGSVIKNPDQATYTYGTPVLLTANADLGWSFDRWEGDLTGSTNPDTITIYSDSVVDCYFTEDEYTLTVNTVGSGSVDKNPDQATYTYGTPVLLTANADPGWSFDHWSGDDIDGSTTNPETITMNSNKTVTAHFKENITITAARSYATHGAAGRLYIDLMADSNPVENRFNPDFSFEFDLSGPVSSVSSPNGTVTILNGGYTVQVNLTNPITNRNWYTITLNGDVEDTFTVGYLKGDTDHDGIVSTADFSIIKPRFGKTPASPPGSGFCDPKYDTDNDGIVSTADASIIKPRFGHGLP